MHYSLKNRPLSITKGVWVVPIAVLVLLAYKFFERFVHGTAAIIIGFVAFWIVIFAAASNRSLWVRGVMEFDLTEEGIEALGKKYPWADFKGYAWSGEKYGAQPVGPAPDVETQPVTPISVLPKGKSQVLELHLGTLKDAKLMVDSVDVAAISALLEKKRRETHLEKAAGNRVLIR